MRCFSVTRPEDPPLQFVLPRGDVMFRSLLFLTGLACTLYGIFLLLFRSNFINLLRPRNTAMFPFEGPLLPVGPPLLILLGVWSMTWVWERRKLHDTQVDRC